MGDSIKVKVILINQPIGTFFVGKMSAASMKIIAKASERKFSEKDDAIYGVQRKLRADRQKEITKYIQSPDATFPNSIILAFNEGVEYLTKTGELLIPLKEDVAAIVDGQHRLSGFKGDEEDFDLIFSGFLDLDVPNQAMIFATINGKQTRVNPSHVYDLYEMNPNRSPIKTCHTIVKAFNESEKSPWFRRIKMLGGAKWEKYRDLSQSAFVNGLVSYISKDQIEDENILRKEGQLKEYTIKEQKKYIFRSYFINDEDEIIYKILSNYFKALSETFPTEWSNKDKKYNLTKTTGFNGFMKLFRAIYLEGELQKKLDYKFFVAMLQPLKGQLNLNSENYQPGAVGENELFKESLGKISSLLSKEVKAIFQIYLI